MIEAERKLDLRLSTLQPTLDQADRKVFLSQKIEHEVQERLEDVKNQEERLVSKEKEIEGLKLMFRKRENELEVFMSSTHHEKRTWERERQNLTAISQQITNHKLDAHKQWVELSKHSNQVYRMMSLLKSLPFEQFLDDYPQYLPSWDALKDYVKNEDPTPALQFQWQGGQDIQYTNHTPEINPNFSSTMPQQIVSDFGLHSSQNDQPTTTSTPPFHNNYHFKSDNDPNPMKTQEEETTIKGDMSDKILEQDEGKILLKSSKLAQDLLGNL